MSFAARTVKVEREGVPPELIGLVSERGQVELLERLLLNGAPAGRRGVRGGRLGLSLSGGHVRPWLAKCR